MPRINLMLTESGDIQHHSDVKRIGASLYDQTKHKARKHFCLLCLSSFTMKEILKRHEEVSIGINCRPTKAEMPKQEKNLISFQNYNKQLKAPYVTYADVEAIVEKMQWCEQNKQESYTEKTSHHVACGYAYKVVRSDGETRYKILQR